MDFLKSVIKNTPLEGISRSIYQKFKPIPKGELYDQQTLAVMKRHLKDNSICIDIGAHQGIILKEMLALAPHGKFFAFEPLPHLAKSLGKNFPEIDVYELALSDKSEEIEFQYVVNDPAYSGIRQRIYDRPNPEIKKITMVTNQLDNIIPSDLLISFIKIDIEGAEYLAMRGGIKTIQRSRPVIVFEAGQKSTSCYDIGPEEIFDFLTKECQLDVSTMERWLKNKRSFSRQDFCNHFDQGLDFYFIAYPE